MDLEKFHRFLYGALQVNASDIHMKVGSPPIYRIQNELRTVRGEPLTQSDMLSIVSIIARNHLSAEEIPRIKDFDASYAIPGQCRFRVNIFRQRGNFSMAFRMIPEKIPSFDDLLLPPQLVDLASFTHGLVLVTGATGSGKSSTLAALINHINETRRSHIITIEDPIEFLHQDKRSTISQREVGTDTDDFNHALRAALRQDPDVILVGEMRDLETIDIALKAAETGHMVFSTVHTTDAAKTVGRLIGVFPREEQEMVRLRLSENLRGTVSQRLLPRADGEGMVVAVELMKVTGTIQEAIRNSEETGILKDLIERSRHQYGMMSFDQSLTDLFKGELVTFEVAKKYASNPSDFERALHFE